MIAPMTAPMTALMIAVSCHQTRIIPKLLLSDCNRSKVPSIDRSVSDDYAINHRALI